MPCKEETREHSAKTTYQVTPGSDEKFLCLELRVGSTIIFETRGFTWKQLVKVLKYHNKEFSKLMKRFFWKGLHGKLIRKITLTGRRWPVYCISWSNENSASIY